MSEVSIEELISISSCKEELHLARPQQWCIDIVFKTNIKVTEIKNQTFNYDKPVLIGSFSSKASK